MDGAGGYEEYAFVADLYDWVVPYRERPDVSFFVEVSRIAVPGVAICIVSILYLMIRYF